MQNVKEDQISERHFQYDQCIRYFQRLQNCKVQSSQLCYLSTVTGEHYWGLPTTNLVHLCLLIGFSETLYKFVSGIKICYYMNLFKKMKAKLKIFGRTLESICLVSVVYHLLQSSYDCTHLIQHSFCTDFVLSDVHSFSFSMRMSLTLQQHVALRSHDQPSLKKLVTVLYLFEEMYSIHQSELCLLLRIKRFKLWG